MANPHMSAAVEEDLPRTFRRDKAEKAAREAAEAAAAAEQQRAENQRKEQYREADVPRILETRGPDAYASDGAPPFASTAFRGFEAEPQPAVVRALKIPFFHLMWFCLKLTLAAIPALILLGAILYGMGQVLKIYLPWLVQAEILIRFPK